MIEDGAIEGGFFAVIFEEGVVGVEQRLSPLSICTQGERGRG